MYNDLNIKIKKVFEKYQSYNSNLWLNSLCFYSIISVVPLFAILLSFGKWLGIADLILKTLEKYSPLDYESINIIVNFSDRLLENARGGVLAGLGFVFLLWTLISMFSVIENALNNIWLVKKQRNIIRKISDYLTFFICLPLFLLVINAALFYAINKLDYIPYLYRILSSAISFFSTVLLFAAFYIFMPNKKVNVIFSLFSSTVVVLLFVIIQNITEYLQILINTYNFIYGSFAYVFFFIFWIRITWFLFLFGAHLNYILQNQSFFNDAEIKNLNFTSEVYIGYKIIKLVYTNFNNKKDPITFNDLKKYFDIPKKNIQKILNILIDNDLLSIDNKNNILLKKAVSLNEVANIMLVSGESIDIENNFKLSIKIKGDTIDN